jgi:uncharacterized damage-inducible protein DinB
MVRPDFVLESWRQVRLYAVEAVQEWPASEAGFRLAPEVMTFAEIARHIAEAGHILTGILLSGETDYARPGFREEMPRWSPGIAPTAPLAVLAVELDRLVTVRIQELRGQSPEWWAGLVHKWSGEEMTRLEFLQFTKEHELTHLAQLFACMRLKGLTPPTTRRRQAEK